jgi:hypothetical protein
VTDNAFVIVWTIRDEDDANVRLGTLGVTVRPNGATTVTPRLDEPFARQGDARRSGCVARDDPNAREHDPHRAPVARDPPDVE